MRIVGRAPSPRPCTQCLCVASRDGPSWGGRAGGGGGADGFRCGPALDFAARRSCAIYATGLRLGACEADTPVMGNAATMRHHQNVITTACCHATRAILRRGVAPRAVDPLSITHGSVRCSGRRSSLVSASAIWVLLGLPPAAPVEVVDPARGVIFWPGRSQIRWAQSTCARPWVASAAGAMADPTSCRSTRSGRPISTTRCAVSPGAVGGMRAARSPATGNLGRRVAFVLSPRPPINARGTWASFWPAPR
jgi:hypothetical protein